MRFLFLLFLIANANAMDVELPSALLDKNNNEGRPFFGFSSGVNLFAPYRDSGDESLRTLGNVTTIFGGYAVKDWILIIGYEHSLIPANYYNNFNDISGSGNLLQHPELFVEANYYLTRKYFWQPYLTYGMSTGWESHNGNFSSDGVDNHYEFGGGINFIINDKFNININSLFEIIKHQALPMETYMKFGLDLNHRLSRKISIIYAIVYRTPKLNDRNTSIANSLPAEIDFHGHSALLLEIGFLFA